jgi:hypothetical protein
MVRFFFSWLVAAWFTAPLPPQTGLPRQRQRQRQRQRERVVRSSHRGALHSSAWRLLLIVVLTDQVPHSWRLGSASQQQQPHLKRRGLVALANFTAWPGLFPTSCSQTTSGIDQQPADDAGLYRVRLHAIGASCRCGCRL